MITKEKPVFNAYMPIKAQGVLGCQSRFKSLWGGRGSGKSYSIADALLLMAAFKPLRILCTRETQKSIKDSVHKLICDRIEHLELTNCYTIQRDLITSKVGSEFIFKGLRHNISEIKSTEGIDVCWIEEAEKVSENSWQVLIPTIRAENSEIWLSWNPEDEKSATYQRFVVNPPPFCKSAHMTYLDNKYFPAVLLQEAEYDRIVDPEKYEHVWEGKLKKYHDAIIFTRVESYEFEAPKSVQFHFGCDWGYSNDPMAINRMYIVDKTLYIDYEFYATGVELTEGEMTAAFDTIPGIKEGRIRSDNSRPETIAFVKRLGYDIVGEAKLTIAEGITYLKAFEKIVIHPRCKGAIDDFGNYRWKQDPQTQEILTIPVDKSNHVPDNVRYALRNLIKQKKSWGAA